MKKIFLLILILAGIILSQKAKAQLDFIGGGIVLANNADYKLDGVTYNNKSFGFNLRASYNYSKKLKIVPSINIYLPNKTNYEDGGSSKVSVYAFNLDGHYIINHKTREKYRVYLLAGAHISGWNIKDERTTILDPNGRDINEFKFVIGANAGAGMQLPLTNRLHFFAEVKYTIAKSHQLVFNPGLKYEF